MTKSMGVWVASFPFWCCFGAFTHGWLVVEIELELNCVDTFLPWEEHILVVLPGLESGPSIEQELVNVNVEVRCGDDVISAVGIFNGWILFTGSIVELDMPFAAAACEISAASELAFGLEFQTKPVDALARQLMSLPVRIGWHLAALIARMTLLMVSSHSLHWIHSLGNAVVLNVDDFFCLYVHCPRTSL